MNRDGMCKALISKHEVKDEKVKEIKQRDQERDSKEWAGVYWVSRLLRPFQRRKKSTRKLRKGQGQHSEQATQRKISQKTSAVSKLKYCFKWNAQMWVKGMVPFFDRQIEVVGIFMTGVTSYFDYIIP